MTDVNDQDSFEEPSLMPEIEMEASGLPEPEFDMIEATDNLVAASEEDQIPFSDVPLKVQVESVLFASPKCMRISDLLEVVGPEHYNLEQIQAIVDELKEEYENRAGGFSLESVRGHGYQFRTVAESGFLMARLFASRPRPLSRAALETLSIIAYRQPVTRAEIEFIRGVDAGNIVKTLVERDIVACVGRKEEAGRPMIFGTTNEFLSIFGIKSLKDLPPLSSFQANVEAIEIAEKKLADEETEIEEGDFVGDDSREELSVSGGVSEVEARDDNERNDASLVTTDTEIGIEGAQVGELDAAADDEIGELAFANDDQDTDPEIELAADSEEEEIELVADSEEKEEEIELVADSEEEAIELAAKHDAPTRIEGAVRADTDSEEDTDGKQNQTEQMDGPDGSGFSTRSRSMDPEGADFD